MADQYAIKAAKVAVAQLAEAAGFEAVQQSSLDTLAELLLRYINEIGSASHSYAELAGRTESNALDVLLALNDLGVTLGELSDYARMQDEIPYAQSIAPFPIKRKPTAVPTFLDKNEVPPSHVPGFLPAFPDKHTYISTPAFLSHERDPHKRQAQEGVARQDAVRAMVRLQARMAPDNKLLEKRAPGAEEGEREEAAAPSGAGTKGAEGSAAVNTNPFLGPILWENRLDHAGVSDEPAGQPPAGPASAAAPPGDSTGEPQAAVSAAIAELAGAGKWQLLSAEAEGQPGGAAQLQLFQPWDWKASLQRKARLAVSGGEQKDAFGQTLDTQVLGTKHGRRAKRTERALAAQLEIGDPTRRRVEEILAARQEEADGGGGAGGAEEEAAAAQPDQEHI